MIELQKKSVSGKEEELDVGKSKGRFTGKDEKGRKA